MATSNPTVRRPVDPAAGRTTRIEKGISLARGPALILGTILLVAGLYLLYKALTFPPFSNFPSGTAHRDGDFFLGLFGANGWTGMLTAVGGGLLLFGAAQHLLAKTMSLIVGVVLAAAALIAVFNSGNVLGMAAANGWTELGWGVCAVILLFNTLIPRRRREVIVADDAALAAAPAAGTGGAYRGRRTATDETAVDQGAAPVAGRETVAGTGAATTADPATENAGTVAPRTHNGQPLVTREDGTPVDGSGEGTVASDTQATRPLQRP